MDWINSIRYSGNGVEKGKKEREKKKVRIEIEINKNIIYTFAVNASSSERWGVSPDKDASPRPPKRVLQKRPCLAYTKHIRILK